MLITTLEAREYLLLRRLKELKNLRHMLNEEAQQELARQIAELKRVVEGATRSPTTVATIPSGVDLDEDHEGHGNDGKDLSTRGDNGNGGLGNLYTCRVAPNAD